MFVTLFSFSLQVSFRNDYFFLLIDRHCEKIHWLWFKYQSDHDWNRKIQNKCDRREKINAKTENAKRKQKIYAKRSRMKILLKILNRENICKLIWWNDRYFKTKQKQKQQNDIDFANVCCFKFLEFELFEFLLIDAFWLTANFENIQTWNKILTHRRLTKNCEKNELVWLNNKLNWSMFFFYSCHCFRIVCNKFISF